MSHSGHKDYRENAQARWCEIPISQRIRRNPFSREGIPAKKVRERILAPAVCIFDLERFELRD
jgi:hypothetical protein